MKRREFITLLGGAAAAWPFSARAQQVERVRRIGVAMSTAEDDAESKARIAAFLQGLQQLGWADGRNVRIDTRWWGASDADAKRRYAAELVALAPDVILASGGSVMGALLQATRTVPIVFTLTVDPVGAGYVASLVRPGGNMTGTTFFSNLLTSKRLGLLREILPNARVVAALVNPNNANTRARSARSSSRTARRSRTGR